MSEEEKYYNKISKNTIMSVEDAKNIINDMRNDKFKIIGKVKYTNLETATIRMLKEAQSLERKLERLKQENKELKADSLENARILEVFDDRKYRKKYLEERRKEEPNLLYPDGDEIYKRYYEQKKQIDLMAEYISNIQDCPLENCGVDLDCENRCNNNEKLIKECWKIYFEIKVKEEIK